MQKTDAALKPEYLYLSCLIMTHIAHERRKVLTCGRFLCDKMEKLSRKKRSPVSTFVPGGLDVCVATDPLSSCHDADGGLPHSLPPFSAPLPRPYVYDPASQVLTYRPYAT